MASHSGKVTIGHSKVWWEVGRWSEKPCHDIPFVVFFKIPYGWFSSFKTLSMKFDPYSREMVHWTPTTFVCGFWLVGNRVSYTLSTPYSLWNGYWSLKFSIIEHLHHISDHIHEWIRWIRLIKAPIPDQLLANWFTKSLLPPISWDVAMGSAVTKEQAISRA